MRYLFLLLTATLVACGGDKTPAPADTPAPEALRAHSQLFEQGVVKVTDGVYVAIGYGLANSIMLEGNDGIIIVDTMETVDEGERVLAAFREITDKPIKALIYTHNHADHVFGARAFAAPARCRCTPTKAPATTSTGWSTRSARSSPPAPCACSATICRTASASTTASAPSWASTRTAACSLCRRTTPWANAGK